MSDCSVKPLVGARPVANGPGGRWWLTLKGMLAQEMSQHWELAMMFYLTVRL